MKSWSGGFRRAVTRNVNERSEFGLDTRTWDSEEMKLWKKGRKLTRFGLQILRIVVGKLNLHVRYNIFDFM